MSKAQPLKSRSYLPFNFAIAKIAKGFDTFSRGLKRMGGL